MYSHRFGRAIHLTAHARTRMVQRGIDDDRLLALVETGDAVYKDDRRLWIAKAFDDRSDNLICVAAVLEDNLVIKTVMHHFRWTR
jgi:hypothetical protein